MKNLLLLLSLIIGGITLSSCNKTEPNFYYNTCDVLNPAEEIEWLKDAIDDVQNDPFSYFRMGRYKGETVFINGNCNPLANYASIIINCNGDRLGNWNNLKDEISNIIILWKHEETLCNL